MNTILWFYFAALEPVFRFFYPVCDWLLSWWVLYLPPVWAVAATGLVTGLGVNLFQKFFSNQKFLGACKSDLDLLNARIKVAKKAGDDETFARLNGLAKTIGGKYAIKSMLPSLWTIPPVIVLCMWIASRLAYLPIMPGEPVKVTASMEVSAKGFATMLPCDGVEIKAMRFGAATQPSGTGEKEGEAQVRLEPFNSVVAEVLANKDDPDKKAQREKDAEESSHPAWYKPWKHIYIPPNQAFHPWQWNIQTEEDRVQWVKDLVAKGAPPPGPEANWLVRFTKAGEYTLVIRHSDKDHEVKVKVREKGGHAPEVANYFLWSSPTEDQIQFVNFDLKDNMPSADWNLGWRWIGVYFIVAIVFGVGLRFALGVK